MENFHKFARLILLAVLAFGVLRLSVRLHEIDQDIDNCSDFLQLIAKQ